jgi:hypothetical protein
MKPSNGATSVVGPWLTKVSTAVMSASEGKPDLEHLSGRHTEDHSRGANGFQGTIRSERNSRMSRTNISSLSTTSWKPKRRDLVTSDITSQSQLKT